MDRNAEQIAYWNGPVGERWTREQDALDRAFASFTAALLDLAALRAGERVLDVGCGCGTPTIAAAGRVGPGGEVLGVDVSAPMLARAGERSAGRANVSYLLADASTSRFDRSFDVVMSRFGVMFFDDPVGAFTNLRSALRSGGRACFACWRPFADNEWARVPFDAAARQLPPQPPSDPEQPGPFSLADAARVERVLRAAGFASVGVAPYDGEVVLSDEGVDAAVRFTMTIGPTARLIREADDDAGARVRGAIEAALRPLARGDRVVLGGASWLVEAT